MGPLKKIIHYLGKSGGIVVWSFFFFFNILFPWISRLIYQKVSMKFEGDRFFQIKISNWSYTKSEPEKEIGSIWKVFY